MFRCKKCQCLVFDGVCDCEPFEVYYPEYYGEDKEIIYGHSHEMIVETVAEEINQDEPKFDTDIFEAPIVVTDKNGVEKSFNCVAMVEINYSVRELTNGN